ncbi:cytochrome b-c1 complex subunit 7 [Nomia melanderi]|uniref:cytochrome b-c1 complex subunit 7 n=1 Tax=Nomia melanderi TaxID=2448451 RepID=UPI0013047599|nr:cytochrome b-c1 complex subunit 7-like [Nomia melanderi]
MGLLRNIFRNETLRKWAYNASTFNQYGLMRDDCRRLSPEVEEALRRLPKHLVEERNFRIIRAHQLECNKTILPKDEWTKLEEDVLYLTPYVNEVLKEQEEKDLYEAQ